MTYPPQYIADVQPCTYSEPLFYNTRSYVTSSTEGKSFLQKLSTEFVSRIVSIELMKFLRTFSMSRLMHFVLIQVTPQSSSYYHVSEGPSELRQKPAKG